MTLTYVHFVRYLYILCVRLVYFCLSPSLDTVDFSSSAYCEFSLTVTSSGSSTVLSHANKAQFSGVKLTNGGKGERRDGLMDMKGWREVDKCSAETGGSAAER